MRPRHGYLIPVLLAAAALAVPSAHASPLPAAGEGMSFFYSSGTTTAYALPVPGQYVGGSGGGPAPEYAQPAYQAGVVPATIAGAANPRRVVPDMAADADLLATPVLFGVTLNGVYTEADGGGTSASTPLFWAAATGCHSRHSASRDSSSAAAMPSGASPGNSRNGGFSPSTTFRIASRITAGSPGAETRLARAAAACSRTGS